MLRRRLQSTLTAPAPTHVSALDLDFVLRLLGSKPAADTSTKTSKDTESNISQWAKVKFNTIAVVPAHTEAKKPLFSSPKKPISPAEPTQSFMEMKSEESIMTRLQSLADSLPTRISPVAPLSFFDPESVMKRATKAIEEEAGSNKNVIKLPTIDYGDRDWSKVTLSSILDKLIPEDLLKAKQMPEEEPQQEIVSHKSASSNVIFSPLELRLLDYDQFMTLAHFLSVKCKNLTDLKIEAEILTKFGASPGPLKLKRVSTKAKDGFAWTETMESLLLRLYDETRIKKQAIDSKFAGFLQESGATLIKDKRKTAERGLWAVLTDEFSVQAGWKVNVTEIKKKIQVLKCLKLKK